MSWPITTSTVHHHLAGSSQPFGLSSQKRGNGDGLLTPNQIEQGRVASSDHVVASLQERSVTSLSSPQPLPNPAALCLNFDNWRTIQAPVLERKFRVHGKVLDRIFIDEHILMLAVLHENNDLRIERWDLNTGAFITGFNFHNRTSLVSLIDKNHILYTMGPTLYLYDTDTHQVSMTLEMEGTITWLIQLKNGHIAAAINGTSIEVWDLASRSCLSRFVVADPLEIARLQAALDQAKIDCANMEKGVAGLRKQADRAKEDLSSYMRGPPDSLGHGGRDWTQVKHESNLSRVTQQFDQQMHAWGGAERAIRRYQEELFLCSIHFIKELPDGRLCVAFGDHTKRLKFNLEGIHLAEGCDPHLVGPEFFSNDRLMSCDGRTIVINQAPFAPQTLLKREASILIFQAKEKSLKEKLLALLSNSPEKTIAFSSDLVPVLTFGELDEFLTICEENKIVTGIVLPERPSSPLLRTRAHHLCPRPRFSLSKRASTEIPDDFICPISSQIMLDPVTAADGESYEREKITEWLTTHQTSPKHGTILEHTHLSPNRNLQRRIGELLQRYPFLFEQDNGNENSVYIDGVVREVKAFFNKKDSNNLQRLIERYPQLMALPLENDQTILHMACSQPSDELLKAVIKGLGKNIVPILIRYNVELFFRMAVRSMGGEGGRIIATATFWKEADYLNECHEAIRKGDIEIVDACLVLGLSLNVIDEKSGNGLLHEAVAKNQQQVAEFLVNYGADVKLKNSGQFTPEELAYHLGYQHLVRAMHETYMRKISAPQLAQTTHDARSTLLEAQNRRLAEEVAALQRQVAELTQQQREKSVFLATSLTQNDKFS